MGRRPKTLFRKQADDSIDFDKMIETLRFIAEYSQENHCIEDNAYTILRGVQCQIEKARELTLMLKREIQDFGKCEFCGIQAIGCMVNIETNERVSLCADCRVIWNKVREEKKQTKEPS